MVTRSQAKSAALNSNPTNCAKCDQLCEDNPKVKDEQSIQCDCCGHYFHIGCVNVVEGKLQAAEEYNQRKCIARFPWIENIHLTSFMA